MEVSTTLARYETFPSVSGADGNRTHDPRLAKPVLSQLSYRPVATAANLTA